MSHFIVAIARAPVSQFHCLRAKGPKLVSAVRACAPEGSTRFVPGFSLTSSSVTLSPARPYRQIVVA